MDTSDLEPQLPVRPLSRRLGQAAERTVGSRAWAATDWGCRSAMATAPVQLGRHGRAGLAACVSACCCAARAHPRGRPSPFIAGQALHAGVVDQQHVVDLGPAARTRIVKRCGSSLAGALAGSALAFSRKAFRIVVGPLLEALLASSSSGFSFARLPPPEAPSNSWAVMAAVFGCSLSSPLRKIRRIVPNWLAKVTIWAWAGVTSKETVLPAGIDFVSGALGSDGLGARDVVDGKYADVLQDGLAEGFADSHGWDPRE